MQCRCQDHEAQTLLLLVVPCMRGTVRSSPFLSDRLLLALLLEAL